MEYGIYECAICGEVIPITELYKTQFYDEGIICPECFDLYFARCERCDELFNICDLDNGFCEDCREHISRCDNCDKWFDQDDEDYFSDDEGHIYCEDCYDDRTFVCDHCRERIDDSNRETNDHDDNISLCGGCYREYYGRCDDCDSVIHYNHAYSDPNSGDGFYCEACVPDDEEPEGPESYSYSPTLNFYTSPNEKTSRFFGWELEVDEGNSPSSLCSDINDNIPAVFCKRDGSLSSAGIEIVSHPMSYTYFRDHFPLKRLLKICRDNGYTSHDPKTCGFHVHISRLAFGPDSETQEKNIAKLLLVVDQNWDQIVKFSRRTESTLNRWCARYLQIKEKQSEKDVIDYAKDVNGGTRYLCVNLQNKDTIEIRVFRGTLNLNTLIATLQFCNLLVDLSYFPLEEIRKINWSHIVNFAALHEYTEFISYSESRGI